MLVASRRAAKHFSQPAGEGIIVALKKRHAPKRANYSLRERFRARRIEPISKSEERGLLFAVVEEIHLEVHPARPSLTGTRKAQRNSIPRKAYLPLINSFLGSMIRDEARAVSVA